MHLLLRYLRHTVWLHAKTGKKSHTHTAQQREKEREAHTMAATREELVTQARAAMAATGFGAAERVARGKVELGEAALALRPVQEAARAIRDIAATGLLTQQEAAALSARLVRVSPPRQAAAAAAAPGVTVAEALPVDAPEAPPPVSVKRSYKVAVVLSPPESLWEPIQNIRRSHDAAYSRWPPHCNLLWPFAAEETLQDVRAAARLTNALQGVRNFRVTLAEFCTFEHSSKTVVWLRPDSDPPGSVEALQKALADAFPEYITNAAAAAAKDDDAAECSGGGAFTAHLTVGQFPKKLAVAARRQLQSRWTPITFEVAGVRLLTRTDTDPFRVFMTIPFGNPQQ